MNRVRWGLAILVILAALGFAAVRWGDAVLQRYKFYRDWRVGQTLDVANGIKMQVEGTFLRTGSNYRLLYVWSRWTDGDPVDSIIVRAAIRTTEQYQGVPGVRETYWYNPVLGGETQEGIPFWWSFHAPPGSPKEIWMRVFYRPRFEKGEERWVDFHFPYYQAEDESAPIPVRKRIDEFFRSQFQSSKR